MMMNMHCTFNSKFTYSSLTAMGSPIFSIEYKEFQQLSERSQMSQMNALYGV